MSASFRLHHHDIIGAVTCILSHNCTNASVCLHHHDMIGYSKPQLHDLKLHVFGNNQRVSLTRFASKVSLNFLCCYCSLYRLLSTYLIFLLLFSFSCTSFSL